MNKSYELIEEHNLIGVPFGWGGRNHKWKLDCYGLVKFLCEERGISIPDYYTPSDKRLVNSFITSEMNSWERTEKRTEGMVALFRTARHLHVGYLLGDGRFAHTWEMSGGVVIEDLSTWERRMLGVYEYVG
ncbi:putative Tail assembly protein [Vibrio coralliirubri]|uniref:NlpC/P60 family protein n=1 Tax=Vibrio coralliirubri TaxID=1516159 RepID=UPI000638842D|nr:NlpC/P60 family protein [Vibrio coralliirubri]CDT54294.1 putative Tail assembly protein [Vibrio coralliirubri]